ILFKSLNLFKPIWFKTFEPFKPFKPIWSETLEPFKPIWSETLEPFKPIQFETFEHYILNLLRHKGTIRAIQAIRFEPKVFIRNQYNYMRA
ncbi:hypothetical protein BGX21_006286, partial [Mortierella sp. AD011]